MGPDLADQVAAAGYIAVAPDLLSGMGPNGGRSSAFTQQQAVEAVEQTQSGSDHPHLAAAADAGSSSRRRTASSMSPASAGVAANLSVSPPIARISRRPLSSTGLRRPKDAIARIKAPVYGFFAGNDARIGATVPGAIEEMKAAGKTFVPVTYDGAGHGFMRAGEAPDAPPADAKARTDAWARWTSLMTPGK